VSRGREAVGAGVALRIVVAAWVLGLLVVDVAVVSVRGGGDGGPGVVRPPVAPADRALVDGLVAFVEGERGLAFRRAPELEVLDAEGFAAALRDLPAEEAVDEPDLAVDGDSLRILEAFGLLDAGFDLADLTEPADRGILGFYDPVRERISVLGPRLDPFTQSVVVHELTHALDDQHFDLRRRHLDADDDANDAFLALVEGNATRVEAAFVDSLDPQGRREVEARSAELDVDPGLPRFFVRYASFPYAAGPGFVAAVLGDGGRARLDRAFAEPPETTEQILHPRAYLEGEGREAVADPPADGAVLARASFGELGLFLVLEESTGTAEAARAATGWGGDRYVAWRAGSAVCVRWDVAMDSRRDLRELAEAFAAVVADQPGATVEVGTRLRYARCVR